MNLRPAAVSYGLCSCAGGTPDAAWNLASSADADSFERLALFESPRHADRLVGVAKGASNPRAGKKISRCADMLLSAADAAMKDILIEPSERRRFGVYFGTSIGGVFETENALLANMDTGRENLRALAYYECSTIAELVAKRFKATGPCMTFSTACSSGGIAFAAACDAISQGCIDIALVCGADALSRITVNGFGSLLLLSQGRCRPFDKNRDGINLGEAGGAVLLASNDFAKRKSLKIFAEISGWFCTADAYHPTAPHPDGDGAARSFASAISAAGLCPENIGCINAHGTGTTGNDIAEAKAIKAAFGRNIPPFFSVKGAFGHTLGASGIVNAVISIEAIRRGLIPPSPGFETEDEEIGLVPQIGLEDKNPSKILSCSLGFGGNNASIVLEREASGEKTLCAKKPFYIFGAGVAASSGVGLAEVQSGVFEGGLCGQSKLLKNIPPLKKRKWAKLQQMFLESSLQALEGLDIKAAKEKTGVCMGTGLGMCAETSRFIINTLEKKEAEPLPTAFTNSVHNAAASLVSLHCGFKGLNSAVTAKEISFECALNQAWLSANSGANDAFIVGSADEYTPYADSFMRNFARYSKPAVPLSDLSVSYFAGVKESCAGAPVARIHVLEISRREFDVSAEALRVKSIVESAGLKISDIEKLYVPCVCNVWQKKYVDSFAKKLGLNYCEVVAERVGANYSASAFAVCAALGRRGLYAQYSLASAGACAITLFEIL